MSFVGAPYGLFLLAIFFAYALLGRGQLRMVARIGLLLVLGDLLYLSFARELHALWDPVGAGAIAWLDGSGSLPRSPLEYVLGALVIGLAIWGGRALASFWASPGGQRAVGRLLIQVVYGLGIAVLCLTVSGNLEPLSQHLASGGQLFFLAAWGLAIGASTTDVGRHVARVLALFVASILFYQAWAGTQHGWYRYLLLVLVAEIILDFYLGQAIEAAASRGKKKALLVISLVSNLGILGLFKYWDFFSIDVFHSGAAPLALVLPAGISFHTFQSLSYTIDVYRGHVKATRSILELATFVLFFPQLVAGPIVRADVLLPQMASLPGLDRQRAADGIFRILLGIFKKLALADVLGRMLVDNVFAAPDHFSSLEVVTGVVAYAFQIYLDFSAYSDIAIGSAGLLGFELPENFRTPYRSASLQEFWRRWHISLSSWLRDYLYIPLGGSRRGPARTYVNLAITMFLGGLWHGANWTFVVWGTLHGFGLGITRAFERTVQHDRCRAGIWLASAAVLAVIGRAVHLHYVELHAQPDQAWLHVIISWLWLAPLWAIISVLLAQVGASEPASPSPGMPSRKLVLALRLAAGGLVVGTLLAERFLAPPASVAFAAAAWAAAASADFLLWGGFTRLGWMTAFRTSARIMAVLLTFIYVCVAWIFFRAPSLEQASAVLAQIFTRTTDSVNLLAGLKTALAIAAICHLFPDGTFAWVRRGFVRLPAPLQALVITICALILRRVVADASTEVPFIYFQF
jgi:D-alanyl-lipoteichoic acid acyltransferase DltB (MBOAT superfamily)